MCSSNQIKRRMNTYRDEVGEYSGWEISKMRTVTATTTKGGGEREGWYNDDAVNDKKCNKDGQKEIGNKHGASKNKKKENPREESCGVVELVQAMLVLTRMYKLIICMVRDVRTITT